MANLIKCFIALAVALHSMQNVQSKCPTWTLPNKNHHFNDSQACVCGESIGGFVKCDPTTLNASLLMRKCITYDNVSGMAYVTSCPFKTAQQSAVYMPLPRDPTQLNRFICSPFNRKGLVCSECEQGYGPSVFSNTLKCHKCSGTYHGWALYIFLELFPVTILFSFMTVFHIRLTSSGANCYLFNIQMIGAVLSYGTHTGLYPFGAKSEILHKITLTVYGFANLDFFREIIPPFCVDEKINGMHSLALSYVSVLYLIALTLTVYFILEMHYRGCRFTMWLWRHIFKHLIRVKQTWTIKTSLVDALATALLLSYSRLMLTSFNILYPAVIYDMHGNVARRTLNFQENWDYFGKKHIPFAILAIITLFFLLVIPLGIFFIYPSRICKRLCVQVRCIEIELYSFVELFQGCFVELFQGCFKDGTNYTRDFRWFSIFYFLLRIVMFVTHIIGFGGTPRISFLLPGIALLCASQAFFLLRPYKNDLYNKLDGTMLSVASLLCFLQSVMVLISNTLQGKLIGMAIEIGFFIPLIIIILYISYLIIKFFRNQILCQQSSFSSAEEGSSEIFPDRVLHPEEYNECPSGDHTSLDEDLIVLHSNFYETVATY